MRKLLFVALLAIVFMGFNSNDVKSQPTVLNLDYVYHGNTQEIGTMTVVFYGTVSGGDMFRYIATASLGTQTFGCPYSYTAVTIKITHTEFNQSAYEQEYIFRYPYVQNINMTVNVREGHPQVPMK